MRRFFQFKEPIDPVVIAYQVIVIVLIFIFYQQIDHAIKQLLIHFGVIAFIFIVRWYSRPNLFSLFLNVWLPYLCIPINFSQLPDLIPSIQTIDYDYLLIQFDHFLFNGHPTVWLEQFYHPVFAELLVYIYISFYFLPIILIHRLNNRGKIEEAVYFKFIFFTGFYLSYLGYFSLPAIGPRFTLQQFQSFPIYGIWFTETIQHALNTLEQINRDAFPSGHTMMTTLCAIYAWKYDRFLGKIYILLTVGMIIATVYLRYHYVIDVIAGLLFIGILYLFAPKLYRFIAGRLTNRWFLGSHKATDILIDPYQK
ncbi:MAG: phosphatase PAP2 family protein [Calditrichaeota bacterium]|nr:phosphatase PAP2 family protein [Calditrichota bacterium]